MMLPWTASVIGLHWSIWNWWPTIQSENQRLLVAKDWRPPINDQQDLGKHHLAEGPKRWSSVWNWPTTIDDPRSFKLVPLERDINIAVNGCSGFATSTQKGPFTAMLISRSRGTYLIQQISKWLFSINLYSFYLPGGSLQQYLGFISKVSLPKVPV